MTIDVERMLRETVPGGTSCDPQAICDDIRAWFAANQADALAAIKAKLEQAAQLVEQMTLRQRTMRAAGDAKPVAPCEIADAIRRLGEEAGRGE